MADLQQLFQFGQQVQGRIQQLQHELANRTVQAAVAGGLVKVTVDGRGLVRSLAIDPAALDGRDAELLSDLVLSAVGEAQRRAQEMAQSELKKVGPLPFGG